MFKNYLKIAFRNLIRHKTYSIINIMGLAIGMACTILILLWVQYERSYDRFHENKDVISRIIAKGKEADYFSTPAPLGPAIKQEIPEIKNIARIRLFKRILPQLLFKYNEHAFYEKNGIIADPSLFEIFTFPFIRGDYQDVLTDPFSIVLTETMAKKYFGDENPINKTLEVDFSLQFTVKGIVKDIPSNSHIQFDFFIPFKLLEAMGADGLEWGDPNFMIYIQMDRKNYDMADIGQKITQVARDNNCWHVVHGGTSYYIQPLNEIYLHPVGFYDIPLGNIKYVYIFSIVALLILTIACINYINLSTAKSLIRAKEVGVRKVVGASRKQVFFQMLAESIIFTVIALNFALIFAKLFLPHFNNLSGQDLHLNYTNPEFMLSAIIITVVTSIMAGCFPALVLSAFNPVNVLKKIIPSKKAAIRRILVISQFVFSIILVICTIIVFLQLQFIRNKSWNLGDDLIIHVPVHENIGSKYEIVKNDLLKNPAIVSVTVKDCLPIITRNITGGIDWEGKTSQYDNIFMETTRVGFDYFKTFNLPIVQGRTFSKSYSMEKENAFILNEEAIRIINMNDPIGKMFQIYGKRGNIVGIVENSYYQSFKQKNQPRVYHLFTNIAEQASLTGAVFIKVKGAESKNISQIIKHIKNVWDKVNTVAPFEYAFLDKTIDSQYKNEQRVGKIFSYMSLLTIAISCLGLFGLISFTIEQRTKEIGIRKTVGASVTSIVYMLCKDFTKWIVWANIISWPIAYYAMSKWLQNFVYRINIAWWVFVAAGSLTLFIALLTVSFQAIKAATRNPVESLRYE